MYRDMKSGNRVEGIATPLLAAALTRLKIYEERQAGQGGR